MLHLNKILILISSSHYYTNCLIKIFYLPLCATLFVGLLLCVWYDSMIVFLTALRILDMNIDFLGHLKQNLC